MRMSNGFLRSVIAAKIRTNNNDCRYLIKRRSTLFSQLCCAQRRDSLFRSTPTEPVKMSTADKIAEEMEACNIVDEDKEKEREKEKRKGDKKREKKEKRCCKKAAKAWKKYEKKSYKHHPFHHRTPHRGWGTQDHPGHGGPPGYYSRLQHEVPHHFGQPFGRHFGPGHGYPSTFGPRFPQGFGSGFPQGGYNEGPPPYYAQGPQGFGGMGFGGMGFGGRDAFFRPHHPYHHRRFEGGCGGPMRGHFGRSCHKGANWPEEGDGNNNATVDLTETGEGAGPSEQKSQCECECCKKRGFECCKDEEILIELDTTDEDSDTSSTSTSSSSSDERKKKRKEKKGKKH